MSSSSKTIQKLCGLMAEYDMPMPRYQSKSRLLRPKPMSAPRIKRLVHPSQIDREIRQAVARKTSEPRPRFKPGQRVFIDRLRETGTISAIRGYDPFGGEISYDLVLDASGKEVAWTEKHLTKAR
jgi:hypothetical protein